MGNVENVDLCSKQQKFIYDAKEGTVLYVGNVRLSTTAYELRHLFEFFGVIDDVKLGTDDDGNRADYALIRFACVEDAMAAQDWNGQYEIQGLVLKKGTVSIVALYVRLIGG
ncbi:RNA-binding protein 39-like protein isoform X2 [Tanacetum coccineum]